MQPSIGFMESALGHAKNGWNVLPLAEGEKYPVTRRGFYDASRDEGQIREWWADGERRFNVGVSLPEGLSVIDCDSAENFKTLLEVVGEQDTVKVRTLRGVHLYYKGMPEGLTQTKDALGPGVDLRVGGRGYMVAPGSARDGVACYRSFGRPFVPILATAWPRDMPLPLPTSKDVAAKTPPEGRISREQQVRIFTLCWEHGVDEEAMRGECRRISGSDRTTPLTQVQYEELCLAIQK